MSLEEENFGETENLKYLNLRANKIEKMEEILKLKNFSNLETLIVTTNPLVDKVGEDYFFEILKEMKFLKRLNKDELDLELKKKLYSYERNKYIEKKKEEKEEEDREKAEEEEKVEG